MKRRLLFSVTILLAISTLSIALSTTAQIKEQPTADTSSGAPSTQSLSAGGSLQSLEDFDIRANLARTLPAQTDELSATSIKLPERRINARASRLMRERPQTQIQISSLTGTASRIYSFQQNLSESSRSDAEATARQFIKTNNDLFRLSSGEVDALKVVRRYQTPGNRVTHLTLQQQVSGIEVFQGEYAVNIDRNGSIISASGELIPEVSKSINLARPRVSAADTLRKAAGYVNAEIKGSLKLRKQAAGAEQRQFFSNEDGANIFARDVESRLVYFPLSADQLRLAWEFILWEKDTPDVYLMVVDAERGSLLYRHNLTWYCFDEGQDHKLKSASHAHSTRNYRSKVFSTSAASTNFYQSTQTPHGQVYTKDSPRPDVPHVSNNPAVVEREDLPFRPAPFNGSTIFNSNDPHFDWWAGQPATSLTSNNVDAYLDRNNDNLADAPRLTVADGNFSFPVDLTQAPTTENNQKAAQVNLFYWVNRYHDILYAFGFNEAAGNFQTDNFGLGGLGNDAIRAEAQDGSGTNNANFSPSRDGSQSRMQMYLWTTASPQLDGDFDQGIIIHELTHGLSTRLVGNGTGLSAMQSRGMGEGWSDYFGLVLMRGPNDDLDGTYAVGQYAFNNYAKGIRRFPYSTSSQVYPLNFGDIARSAQVHNVGEIWCNTLLEMRAQLIRRYGFQEGQRQSIQLVVDGLKLGPQINPTFIDARNAILQADKVSNGGVNQCLIWQAFSKRGLGFSAGTVDASDGAPVESFDMPAACSDLGSIRFDRKSYLLGETMIISVGDRNAQGTIQVRVRSSVTNDQETITMTPHQIFIGHFTASLRVVPGRPISGDGSLQASLQANDKIVISYDDANNGSGGSTQVTAQVEVMGEATLFEDMVESGNRGWSAVGKPAPTWGMTNARFASPSQAWTDSPGGNYGDFVDTSLVSPLFDLSGAGGVVLTFAHSYALESGFDYGSVEYSIDDGVNWKRAAAYTGPSPAFSQVRLTLDALAGQSRVRIRFRLTTDVDTTLDGWVVDDVRIIARTSDLRLIPPQGTLAPMITAVAPASGVPGGGTAVTITGANFTENSDTRVFFDNLPAPTANLRVLGSSTITAVTPPHSAGAVTVRVENRNGAGTLANAFTYFANGSVDSAPVLMNIFPVSGSTRGGTQVTIYGSNFTPQTIVRFDNQNATGVTFINSNTLRVTAPASPNNVLVAVDVIASNPQSTPARLTGAFSYVAPTPPTVSVLSPGGGERLFSGGTVTLRWQSSDNRAVASHQIGLYRGSTLVGAIAEVPGAAQSFNWTIPANTTPVTGARIRVLAIDDENEQSPAFSSGEFTIDRRWVSSTALPSALNNLAVTTDEQYLYTIGGRTGTGNTTGVTTFQRLDPSASSPAWSDAGLAPLPVALNALEAATIQGKIYVPGGFTRQTTIDRNLRIYDIATNAWSSETAPPTAVGNYAIAVDGQQGVFYVTGGSDPGAGVSNVQAYDTRNNTWAQLPPMKTARFAHEAAFINGKLYVVGGSGPSGGLASGEVYNFQTGQWSPIASLNQPRSYAASAVAIDESGRLLWMVFGGEDADTGAPLNSGEAYELANNRWIALDGSFSLPNARKFFNGAVLGGYLHAAGGHASASVRTYERFRLDGFTLINQNQPPVVVVPLAQQIAIPDRELKFTVSAQDLGSGAPIRITADGLPSGAVFNAVNDTNNSARGEFRWTPAASDVGRSFTVTFTASDGALTDVKSVVVRVAGATPLTAVNAADFRIAPLTADSIAAAFGSNLASRIEIAQSLPLPLSLAGTTLTVNGVAAPLFFVSPTQINFVVPPAVDLGAATIIVSSPLGSYSLGAVEIVAAAPALFTADATGRGDASALATIDGVNYQRPPFDVLVNGRPNALVLYGTGIRRAPATDPNDDNGVAESVNVTIDGRVARVLYAGAQGSFSGLDQINVEMPASLAGGGQRRVEVVVIVNNVIANRVTIEVK